MNSREKAKEYLSMMGEFHSADDEEDALVGLLDAHAKEQRELYAAQISAAHKLYVINKDVADDLIERCLNAVDK